MADFTSTTRLKTILGIPSAVTQHDTRLTNIVAAVDRQILDLCGMAAITQQTYTEILDVDSPREDMIALSYRPIVSVSALTNDDSLVATDDYYIKSRSGYVMLKDGWFTEGRQKVQITYVAGESSVPGDLLLAGDELGVAMFNAAPHAGFDSEKTGDYSYTLAPGAVPPGVVRATAGYRRLFAR